MTAGSSPIPTKGPLMPVLALAAAALAVLVWIVPLPILRVPERPEPPPEVAPEKPAQPEVVTTAAPPEWKLLSESLDSLREKAPVVAVTEAPEETPPEEVTQVPTMPAIGWLFKGTIDGPGSSAALVAMNDGRSRFVFVGQQLMDPNNPDGPRIEVREIGADYLLVARGEVEERLPLEKPQLANPLSGRVPPERVGR